MKRIVKHYTYLFSLVVLVFLLAGHLPSGSNLLIANAEAKEQKYEPREFNEKVIIPKNDFKSIDINFNEGEKVEVVFTLQVKDNLPIDVWFVNEDNYLLLTRNAQFLFYIDGSGQQLAYAKRIVALDEHDAYKLVLTNYYANQTVEVDLVYELRTFTDDDEETNVLMYMMIIIIVVLAAIIGVLFLRMNKLKKVTLKESKKPSKRNSKKGKSGDAGSKPVKKASQEKRKVDRSGKTPSEKPKKVTNKNEDSEKQNFCGYCGKAVDTPFCKSCGKKN